MINSKSTDLLIYVTTLSDFIANKSEILNARIVAIDTEGTGLDPHVSRIRLIQIAVSPDRVFVIDLFALKTEDSDKTKQLLTEILVSDQLRIFHNFKFDLQMFWGEGLDCNCSRIFDTQIASQLLDAGLGTRDHKLKTLARHFINIELDKSEQVHGWDVPVLSEAKLTYAAKDVTILFKLREELIQQLAKENLIRVAKLEFDAIAPTAQMEFTGVKLDLEKWNALYPVYETKRNQAEKEVIKYFPNIGTQLSLFPETETYSVNINSSKQVIKYFQELGIPDPEDPNKLIDSVDKNVLKMLDLENYPILTPYLEYKNAQQRINTFIKKFPHLIHPITGRLHANFWQMGTDTGRMSSSRPNLQQLPRTADFRGCFVPEEGKVYCISDFSQIELRLGGLIFGDENIINEYRKEFNGEDSDLHTLTASLVSGIPLDKITKNDRQNAKACFSGDTEILTEKGWIKFENYDGITPLAQYELPEDQFYNQSYWNKDKTGTIEFVKPLVLKKFENRKLFHQEDRNTDLLITEDHEIIFLSNTSTDSKLRKLRADKVKGKCRSFIAAGKYNNSEPFVLSELETRILAMVVSDGSFQGSSIRLEFTKERKIQRCRELLDKQGCIYVENTISKGVTTFRIKDTCLLNKILNFVTEQKQLYWKCIFEIDGSVYLDEAKYWDGHKLKIGRNRVIFSSSVRQTIDVMQAMAVMNNVNSTAYFDKKYPALSYSFDKKSLWRATWKLKETDLIADVYCVQVPSGAIVVRRNGKVVVCGNCNFGFLYSMGWEKFKKYAKTTYGVSLTDKQAREFRKRFFEAYPGIKKYHEKLQRNKQLKEARTLSGRLRRWPDPPGVSALANHPIQGTSADITKVALGLLFQKLKLYDAKIILQVH